MSQQSEKDVDIQEVVVTKAMIEAGVREFRLFASVSSPSCDAPDLVERCFLAMAQAQIPQ